LRNQWYFRVNMKRNFLLFLIGFVFPFLLKAQEYNTLRLKLKGYNVYIPGFEVAYQHNFFKYQLKNEKYNVNKDYALLLNIAPVLDVILYQGNHTGIGLMAETNFQFKFSNGFLPEIFGGYGLYNAFLSGTTYELNENNQFESSNFKAIVYRTWKAGIGLGKIKKLKSNRLYAYSFRMGVRKTNFPGSASTPMVSLGLSYYLNKNEEE